MGDEILGFLEHPTPIIDIVLRFAFGPVVVVCRIETRNLFLNHESPKPCTFFQRQTFSVTANDMQYLVCSNSNGLELSTGTGNTVKKKLFNPFWGLSQYCYFLFSCIWPHWEITLFYQLRPFLVKPKGICVKGVKKG